MFAGDADVARLGCLSPRADKGAWMPRGDEIAACGRPTKRARALCGASLGTLTPLMLPLPAVRRRALSVGLVRSLAVTGALLEVAEELTPETRALKDIPEPAVVAADPCWRLTAVEVEEPSLATVRCTMVPDVLGRICPPTLTAPATPEWVGTFSADVLRGEKSRSYGGATTLLGTLAGAATHEPDEDPPGGGDARRRGVMSTLPARGVNTRCPGGDGEAVCRDLDG